jgi:very-short-patch-repair endonuclease
MGALTLAIHRARKLRSNPTDAERMLWRHLRLRQFAGQKFRRQRPIGPYIVDFVYLDKKLVVELDGGQHSEQKAYDDKRASWLQSEGFTILRFWDHEVLTQIGDVKQAISDALDATPSFVLPRKRGR